MIDLVMMALAFAQNAQPPASNSQAEIGRVVQSMNQQLARWTASIEPSGRLDTCKTIQSSGDPELDAVACQAMSECAIEMLPVTSSLANPAVLDAEKEKLARESSGKLTNCVADRRLELFRDLAERRIKAAETAK